MSQPHTIAVVSSSPALASVLAATLSARRDWRIRRFETLRELRTYMRVAPIDAVVSDYELADGTVADFAAGLRGRESSNRLAIVALSRTVTTDMRDRCRAAGIDEIIVKPMSPAHIEERLAAQIDRRSGAEDGLIWTEIGDRRAPQVDFGGNVISFAAHRAARQGGQRLGR